MSWPRIHIRTASGGLRTFKREVAAGVARRQPVSVRNGNRRIVPRPGWFILPIFLLVVSSVSVRVVLADSGQQAAAESAGQPTFGTPQAALQALVSAAESNDRAMLMRIFGPEAEQLLSADPVEDSNDLRRFSASLHQFAQLQNNSDSYTVLVGEKHWPFPIPIVKQGNRWRYDTRAGLNEILNRRIGENELSAIATCRAYAMAQWEYYTESGPDHGGLAVYAQKLFSSPGRHDGLYWPTTSDEKPSPLGERVAQASDGPQNRSQSNSTQSRPYHGYFFRILTSQGPSTPGGKFGYIVNGNMLAGYALVAYPAKWGNSGVMTFIVNQQGRVYQKNLGSDTARIAGAMTEYNPDPSWQLVEP